MILQGGTNEISNLDVSGNSIDRIEALKEEIKASSVKMFSIAEESLTLNKGLENVIIFKRMFRCDDMRNDPAQIRAKLSEFGNRALDDIWLTKGCPQNIKIVQQTLECQGDLKTSRFGLASSHAWCLYARKAGCTALYRKHNKCITGCTAKLYLYSKSQYQQTTNLC